MHRAPQPNRRFGATTISPSEMASLNARKPFRVVIHAMVDGRDIVKKRLRFATEEDAFEAYEDLRPHLPEDQWAEVVRPLPLEVKP